MGDVTAGKGFVGKVFTGAQLPPGQTHPGRRHPLLGPHEVTAAALGGETACRDRAALRQARERGGRDSCGGSPRARLSP
jgi:hypothetical protein